MMTLFLVTKNLAYKRCALGSPPQEYNENAHECENSVIKKLK